MSEGRLLRAGGGRLPPGPIARVGYTTTESCNEDHHADRSIGDLNGRDDRQ
ncbi:hypothetical protein MBUL_01537 [Methylobacterium bullatum]|uniref:Uncharacterized protein n=1 Tax=Methylobacterium bullatum TaxID=570505 RepID=A0A679ITD1_9HYPH|nr:hypothetical protein MBUL_01537 [Methylobacterium bullatum]